MTSSGSILHDSGTGYFTVAAHSGLPDIEVLYTKNVQMASDFIQGWQGTYHFGLDMEWKPTFAKGAPPSRAALLQICAGPWVLLLDLTRMRKPVPQPLPDDIWSFLESEEHTFYGMGLREDLGRLAFEFDCMVRGIDFTLRAWPGELELGGGLVGLANRVLGTTVKQSKKVTKSNWDRRPLTEEQIIYAAEDAYLSSAVARYFMDVSFPQEDWLVTEAEMYGAGVKFVEHGLCVPEPWHDWSEARAEWERAQGAIDQKKKNRKAG
eukprot:CAMPEP_0204518916 /NCGR_PEP_ID=MMETSP0661-20131031/4456_1 /ASSEMBLY_ACC=CAM_ASM_000606 /TAXON_ID=109239 /ORGANISM="Alexandrium margalefi, Strain AMGDE01CS-322" /LENGTH=264 /DNA_ID=CAMNT_0051524391 /DNA_START=47 /DNA_END=841 /DNA_ORIENTATION=-